MNLSTLKLDDLPKLGSGLECIVYDLGDGTCYKEYHPFYDIIYYNAKIAHDFGIAPEVYERDKNGYRTEIVAMFNKNCSLGSCENDICYRSCEVLICEEYIEFETKVEELFGEDATADLHIFNIGLKNGKMIMIDFGEASQLSGE